MLEITIPAVELFDEKTQRFITRDKHVLQLEHSLISISKWESKWCKPFLTNDGKTQEETLDYIKCMTLNKNVKDEVYDGLTQSNILSINEYIGAPMTATTFSKDPKRKTSSEQITSELVYYWMIAHNIPSEYDKWHLNRLLTLIRVCNVKNQPPSKMSRREAMSRNAALNAKRRKQLNSRG